MSSERVYEIAKELGVQTKAVVRCLQDAGCFVRSASSTVTPQDAAMVRARLRPASIPAVPDFLSTKAITDAQAALAADVEAIFGSAGRDAIKGRQRTPAPRPTRAPRPGGTPLSVPVRGSSAEERRSAEREQKSVRKWLERMIDPVERRAWLNAGLGTGDFRLVEQCLAHGLTPEHLTIRVDGTRAGDWLRSGEPVGSVVARLRQAGHIANTA